MNCNKKLPEAPSQPLWAVAGRLPLVAMVTAAALATAPFSGFLNRNREEALFTDIWLYAGLYVGALMAVVAAISLVFGRRVGSRWSLVLGWCAFALFWYRDLKELADGSFLKQVFPAQGLVVWVVATSTILVLVARLSRRSWFPTAAMCFAVTIAVVPLGQYSWFSVSSGDISGVSSSAGPTVVLEQRPDIYFLLLDGFGRQDVLDALYEIDTGPFVEELRQNGFVVADLGMSAHPMTWLSLAAILDQEYQALPSERGRPPTMARQIALMAGESRTHQVLKANGYHFVTAATTYGSLCRPSLISEIEECVNERPEVDAAILDAYVRYQLAFMTPLVGLSNSGILPGWLSSLWLQGPELLEDEATVGGKAFLARDVLDAVATVRARGGSEPLFVFAHMMYAHPPFTLGPDCKFRTRGVPDQSDGWGDTAAYRSGIECAVNQVKDLIHGVDSSAVIVVQSDHGPTLGRMDSLDRAINDIGDTDLPIENLWARTSVFSAVRLPDECQPSVSDTYAGVSTFTVVFDCLAGHPQIPEPGSSYWAWHNSRKVIDLTTQLRAYEASRG